MRSRRAFLGLVVLVAACGETPGPATGEVEKEGLLKRSTTERWRMDANGTYTVLFFVNPANGLVLAPPGSECPATGNCDHGVALRQALDEYERLTPIRFAQIPLPLSDDISTNYLHYIDCNAGTSHAYGPNNVPDDVREELEACDTNIMDTLHERLGSDANGFRPDDALVVLRQDVDFVSPGPPVPYHVPLHETGHALNLQHENKRTDAASAGVTLFTDCVGGDMDAFTPADEDDNKTLSPYDIDSMMHYPSTTKCTREGAACGVPGDDGCTCFPLLVTVAADTLPGGDVVECTSPAGTTQKGRLIVPPGDFSDEDLNVLQQMYPPRLGQNSDDDRFGEAVAKGDFDGDGYDDLAVGAPGDQSGGPAAGAVYLFKGTQNGLQPWRKYLAPNRAAGDDFGAALAAGRLDDDGKDDLLVGAPHYRPRSGDERSGAVFVYYGRRRGLGDRHFLHQENTGFTGARNLAGDRYGAALAIGEFNGGGRPEIAIGSPGDLGGGRVYVMERMSGGGYTRIERLGDQRDDGDAFGEALLAADLGGGDNDELYVGSPETFKANGAGNVYVFRANADGFITPAVLSEPNGPVAGDQFGAALASGVFAQGGARKLVVGAPGRSSGRGNVWLMKLTFSGGVSLDSFIRINQIDAGLDGQTGAEMGRALATGDFDDDGRDDLAIGAPYYDPALFRTDAGAVAILRGNAGGAGNPVVRLAPNAHGAPDPSDHYGAALAVGQFNIGSNLDLAVGTPGHDDDSGAVWPLRGQPGSIPEPTGNREFFTDFLDQEYGVQR